MSSNVIPFQGMHSASSLDDESELGFDRFSEVLNEDSNDASGSSYQEGWIISYIDVLTLLLTLFVILLAMSHFKPESETSSLHQLNSQPNESVRQNTISLPSSNDNTVKIEAPVIDEENKTEIKETIVNSTAHQNEKQAKPEESIVIPEQLLIEQHSDVNLVLDTIPYKAIHQQNPGLDSTNEYLNADSIKLFDQQIDVTKIFPVETILTKVNDERAVYEQKEHSMFATDVTNVEKQEQKITPVVTERNTLMQMIENSQLGNQIEVSEVQNRVNLIISDHVLFAPASVELKPEGLALLQQLAGMIKGTKLHISVEGHTDNIPISNKHYPSNWELSTARATGVTRHLISNDIAPNRIRAIGYADTHPRADNTTTQGRDRNRRVSIILIMPDDDTQMGASITKSHLKSY